MKAITPIFLLLCFILLAALPNSAQGATKTVTIEWTMPEGTTNNVIGYNMYYTYDTVPPNTNNPIANCNQYEKITTNSFRMTCPTVEIEQYPVYFYIGAVTESGEIFLSPYNLVNDESIITPVQNFKVIISNPN